MGVLAAKKANFDALTAPRKWAVRFLVGAFELGTPAEYVTAGGDVWYVYSDLAIRPQFVEKFFWMLTKLVPNVTDTPARAGTDYQTTETVQVEVPERVQVEVPVLDEGGNPTGETVLVWQDHPTNTVLVDVEESLGDPLLLAASANGAPAWFTARSVVPESLSPVAGEGE